MNRETAVRIWNETPGLANVVTGRSLEAFATTVERRTIEACKAAIDKWIKPGELQGNGCDDTAQRNGMILASNLLHDMMMRSNA